MTHWTLWRNRITPSCPAYWIAMLRSERFVSTSDLSRHGLTLRIGIRSVKHVVSSGYIVDPNSRSPDRVRWIGQMRSAQEFYRSVQDVYWQNHISENEGNTRNFGTIHLSWWAIRKGHLSKVHSRPTRSGIRYPVSGRIMNSLSGWYPVFGKFMIRYSPIQK